METSRFREHQGRSRYTPIFINAPCICVCFPVPCAWWCFFGELSNGVALSKTSSNSALCMNYITCFCSLSVIGVALFNVLIPCLLWIFRFPTVRVVIDRVMHVLIGGHLSSIWIVYVRDSRLLWLEGPSRLTSSCLCKS